MMSVYLRYSMILAFLCSSCGATIINERYANLSPQEQEAIKKNKPDPVVELEKTLQLTKEADLSSFIFMDAADDTKELPLKDYMHEKGLRAALIIFCKKDNAACRMVNRDLAKDPIVTNDKTFAIFGSMESMPDNTSTLPSYMMLMDTVESVANSQIMENPGKDIFPYFALVYAGKTIEGLAGHWPLDQMDHSKLKNVVRDFLDKIDLSTEEGETP